MEMPPILPPNGPAPTPAAAAPVPAPQALPEGVTLETDALRKSLTPLPMSNDEVSAWQSRIEQSMKRVEMRQDSWDALMDEYDPEVSDGAQASDVKANTHFRNIHTKIGQLFVRSPKVLMSPKGPALDTQVIPDPQTGLPQTFSPQDAIATRQAVLAYYMGAEEIDGLRLMDECLMDMQGYSGFSCVHVGYRSVSMPTAGPMTPMTGQMVQVPIWEEWFADKFSSKKILFDEQLKSPRHQRFSRWIGKRTCWTKAVAKKLYGLTDDEMGQGAETDDRVYPYDEDSTSSVASNDYVWGSMLWYKPIYFTDETHPEKIVELVFVDGVKDRPVVHRPSPDISFDDRGQVTPDSIRGFPIKIGSLRDALDSPFPRADSAFTQALVKQLNTFLQQSVLMRDAAIGKYFYDTDVIDARDLDVIKNGPVGAYIGLKPGTLMQGADKIFYTTAQVHASPDDWRTIGMLKSYMDETLGISATQAGGTTDTVRSATEINAVGANSQGRQEKERSRAVAFYLEIARAVDGYVFRYATGNRWVEVVGQTGAKKLQMWNKTLGAGCYSYDIEVDSQLIPDAARERQLKTAAYNVLGPDPLFRRIVAIRDICRLNGWDPSESTIDEATANANAQAQQQGQAVGQPPHPGGGPINKHVQEQSGRTPNAPAGPGGPGDNRQERNPPPMGHPQPILQGPTHPQ